MLAPLLQEIQSSLPMTRDRIVSFSEVCSPLDQFEVRNLLSLDAPILANLHISFTNIGLYLTIGALVALILSLIANNYNKVVSNN